MADLALKLALSPLLLAQAVRTRWRLPKLPEAAARAGAGSPQTARRPMSNLASADRR